MVIGFDAARPFRGQAMPNLVNRDWRERPTINANIATLTVPLQIAVTVAVKMDCSMMRTIPNPHRIMTKHQRRFVGQRDVQKVIDRSPALGFVDAIGVIVVADNETLVAIQARQVFIVIIKCKVAKVINHIALSDGGIPMHDHHFIHLLN